MSACPLGCFSHCPDRFHSSQEARSSAWFSFGLETLWGHDPVVFILAFWVLVHLRDSDNTGPRSERGPGQGLGLACLYLRPCAHYLQVLTGLLALSQVSPRIPWLESKVGEV